jgi:hypothetical protein
MIYDALQAENGLTTEQLIDVLYGDREDGGPLSAVGVVKVTIHGLNQKLAPAHKIRRQKGSGRHWLLRADEPFPVYGPRDVLPPKFRDLWDIVAAHPGIHHGELADRLGLRERRHVGPYVWKTNDRLREAGCPQRIMAGVSYAGYRIVVLQQESQAA